jgi:hypothetical protein
MTTGRDLQQVESRDVQQGDAFNLQEIKKMLNLTKLIVKKRIFF